jgi:S-adenosylmethionine decarboxylase
MRTSSVPAARSRRGPTWNERSHRAPLELAPAASPSAPGFGPHLIFDGHQCPAKRLADLPSIYALLDQLPARIGMTRIMPPYVFRHDALDPRLSGISGFVLIAESHIGIHAFPGRGFVNVDVFSCLRFDVKVALDAIDRAFAPRRSAWKVFDRGLEFPKHIGGSRTEVMRGRVAAARASGLEAKS